MIHIHFSHGLNKTPVKLKVSKAGDDNGDGMDKVQLLKDLKREALQIEQKIDKIQDPKEKQRLTRNYAELISAVVDISEILS